MEAAAQGIAVVDIAVDTAVRMPRTAVHQAVDTLLLRLPRTAVTGDDLVLICGLKQATAFIMRRLFLLAKQKVFLAQVFDRVAQFGCFFEFELCRSFAHLFFELCDVSFEFSDVLEVWHPCGKGINGQVHPRHNSKQ